MKALRLQARESRLSRDRNGEIPLPTVIVLSAVKAAKIAVYQLNQKAEVRMREEFVIYFVFLCPGDFRGFFIPFMEVYVQRY